KVLNPELKQYAGTKLPSGFKLMSSNTVPKKFTKLVNYTVNHMTRDYEKPEFERTYYLTGDNHHIEIWRNKLNGKIIERVVSLLEYHTYTNAKNDNHPIKQKYIDFEKNMAINGFEKILDLYKKSTYKYNGKLYTLMG